MRRVKKWISLLAAVSIGISGFSFSGLQSEVQAAEDTAETVDAVVRLKPQEASPFNDKNEDGLGEFEGWGTSLCWWANRIGGNSKLTEQAADLFFGDEGLDMNIGRYNVGGGDCVGDLSEYIVPKNEKAQFYDLETEGYTPTYSGSSMAVSENSAMQDLTWTASDADFGITKGTKVGTFKQIGWINKLDDAAGTGDNLHYTVNVQDAGSYTVKLLMTLTGSNDRDVAIRTNEGTDGAKDYVVDAATINSNIIASGNNNMLFMVTVENVALNAGDNTINIAGKSDWTLDFVKMAVIKSGDEGVLPETDEFLHEEHITRSDSGVPGYAVDVTKIDESQHELSWYQDHFARADAECGYAWNYDWDADSNQINVLKAAAAASGDDFIAEAFSNSPPYFMTVSGCSSGNTDSSQDNLREDSVNAFAAYMADVIEHWQKEKVITFQSATAMNEPYTEYWGANSTKQEGCHFDQGESQSRIIEALNEELQKKGIDLIISASDETSIDTQITSYNALSDEAKEIVERIDTHTYSGSNRAGLSELAESAGENLWMSEVDGEYVAGTNAGEMSAALGLAQRMITDVNGLNCSAWILWNAIDVHADNSEEGQAWVQKGSANDFLTIDDLMNAWGSETSNGYWGLAAADHNNNEIVLSMKYYAYGQLSRYIRPGYTVIGTSKGSTLAAYDPEGEKAVIVALNTDDSDKTWKFDLSGFENMGAEITAIRTSGSMESGEKWANVSADDDITVDSENRAFTATLKANSITTYIVEGVSGIRDDIDEDTVPVKQITVTADQVIGSTPWNNGTDTAQKVVDGDYSTFFDGVLNGYVVLDLGEEKEIAAVSYAPRSGYADRCVGAIISGSVDGENWTTLYTIDSTPAEGKDTMVYYNEFTTSERTYRYIKYSVPDDGKSNCNLSELKVYEEESPVVYALTAHYDMSVADGALQDISGAENNAALHDISSGSVASYEDESVLQFNKDGYADLPEGLVSDDGEFTIQATFSTQTQAAAWLWCLGRNVGAWPDVDNYVFVSPMSNQGGYEGKVLTAISQDGEERLPASDTAIAAAGYTTITVVSDGTTLFTYVDGKLISQSAHGKDLTQIIPESGEIGFIGKSLYSADPLLTANISDIKIWKAALDADEVSSVLPGEEEKTNMALADICKAMLKENISADEIATDVAFPKSIDGYDLTWTIPENDAIADDGTVTVPIGPDVTVDVVVAFNNEQHTIALTVPGQDIETILNKALETLDIPNKDDVRGNITLPETITVNNRTVKVTWQTDNSDIVDVNAYEVEGYDSMPAGVVTRPEEDTKVVMTATIEYQGETRTKDIEINVKAKPEEIKESDYTDYFFAYFAGEKYADGEQIYFASSQDGMNWDDLNNNEPVLTSTLGEEGVRDPFIIRSPEGDKFYLIATDLKVYGNNDWTAAQNSGSQSLMVWESTDLVNWSDQRMVEVSADIDAGCTWAPEATYDPLTGEYVVYWASRVPSKDEQQRVYYAKTRDFYSFTEPQLYIEKDQSAIDTTMIKDGDTYYRYTKNEGSSTNELGALTKTIFIEKSDKVLGDFTQIVSDSLNSSDNQYVEGPTIFKLNEDDAQKDTWCLLVDDFGGDGYYPLLTDDLDSGEFEKPETGTYEMPSRARHGTPIRITAEEYEAIMAFETDTATTVGETPSLPETITVGGEEKTVTWLMDDVSFGEDQLYKTIAIKGDVEGITSRQAAAYVQVVPENVEYMIDCNNENSATLAKIEKISDVLLNEGAADQAKTEDNTWGYVSAAGDGDSYDMTAYSGSSKTDPYVSGWWARSGKDISYQVTLPAGEHTVMLGCEGWWTMGRQMDVYYSVDGSEETKLCDLDAVASSDVYAQGIITLDKESVVTLTVKKADSNDPILSWISITGIPAESTPEVNTDELQKAYDEYAAVEQGDYTKESYDALQDALQAAKEVLENKDATQDDVNQAKAALEEAFENLQKEETPAPEPKNGLLKAEDGNWYYYVNDKVAANYTGFASNKNGDWYVEKGQVKFNKYSVIKDTKGTLGTKGTWYYVVKSKVIYTDTVAKNENGWWVIRDGKVDFTYTGFASNKNGDWYAERGKVRFNKYSVIKDKTGALGDKGTWYYVVKSKVVYTSTVAKNENGWWKITNGRVDFGYTGTAKNDNGRWYIRNGKVRFDYSGSVKDGKVTYVIKKGKVIR